MPLPTPTQFDRVIAARTQLVFKQPFFGALALRLKVLQSTYNDTAWTDGKHLGFNEAFMASLTMDEIVFVVAHEVMHCACAHIFRRGGRDAWRWNIAADYAINWILKEAGFTMPPVGLLRDDFGGESAEWIYDRLPEQGEGGQGRGQQGEGDGRPGAGGHDIVDAPVDAAAEGVTEAEWRQAVQQAAAAAKMRGVLPGCLQRFADESAKAKVDWRSVLHRFVQQVATADYTWRRPSKRYIPTGLYLPSLYSEVVGPIVIAVDTSGSIDDITVSQFAAEMRAIVDEVHPERVHVIYCDAQIHREDVFERGEHLTIDPVGGGGTSHVPVMDFVDDMPEPPVCLIALTDLYTGHRAEPPCCPVLWATIGSTEAPYGEIVEVH